MEKYSIEFKKKVIMAYESRERGYDYLAKKYSSYAGEIDGAPKNIVARNFHAEAPNSLWLTGITEFPLPAGKVYLSPVVDCFDGMALSWTIGCSPSAEFTNTMLEPAVGAQPLLWL